MSLKFGWQQIECIRCRARRHRAQNCDVCGAKPDPREVDDLVARRSPVVLRARALLADHNFAAPVVVTVPPFEIFVGLIDGFFATAQGVADAASLADRQIAEASFVRELDRLRGARALAASTARMRPWIEPWRTFDRVVAAFEALFEATFEALLARCQRDGVRKSELVQPAIDGAAAELEHLGERLRRAERVANCASEAEILTALIEEAVTKFGGDVFALEAAGSERCQKVFGLECSPGFGLASELISLLVDVLFDPERFWALAQDIANSSAPGVEDISRTDLWASALLDAPLRLRVAMESFTALIDSARRSDDALRAAMTLAADLVEGPGRRLLAAALSARGGNQLDSNTVGNGNKLIRLADKSGVGSWTTGLEIGLRNGRFHDTYVAADGAVVLKDGTRWPSDALLDCLLAGLETVMALHWGLVVAADEVGVDTGLESLVRTVFEDDSSAVAVMCAAWQWSDVEVRSEGDTMTVDASVPDTHFPLATIASLVAVMQDRGPRWLTVNVRDHRGHSTVEGPLEPCENFRAAVSELEKHVAFLEVARKWTRDGTPFISLDHIAKCVAMAVAPLLNGDAKSRRVTVDMMMRLCRSVGADEALEHLSHVQGATRAVALQLTPLPGEQEAIDFFAHWEKRRLATEAF